MTTTKIYRIYPSIASLQQNRIDYSCPVTDCEKILTTAPALSCHLSKSHKDDKTSGHVLCYHCPVTGCLYDKLSERHFKCFKYLKQHYRKVHAEKTLQCSRCDAAFSQQALLNAHAKQCGKSFKCQCGLIYTSREALLTHAKRKLHQIVVDDHVSKRKQTAENNGKGEVKSTEIETSNFIKPVVIILNGKDALEESKAKIVKPRLLLPKPAPMSSIPLPTLAALALSELSVFRETTVKLDTSTQTDYFFNGSHELCCLTHPCPKRNVKRSTCGYKTNSHGNKKEISGSNVNSTLKRSRRSAQTQTLHGKQNKRQKTSAQTQTLDNRILEKAMAEANLLMTCSTSSAKENIDYFPRQSTHTQTISGGECNEENSFWSNLQPPSPLPAMKLDAIGNLTTLIRNTSSTQTSVNDINERQCNSSQTEKDVFLGHMENTFPLELSYAMSEFSSNSLNSESREDNQSNSVANYDINENNDVSRESPVHTIETQTELDLDSLLMCDSEETDDNILCFNIQTQTTDDNLESIPYDQLLTHMHTQTNEFLFPELSFSDIQTQTSWNDFGFTENVPCPNNVSAQTNVAQTQTRTFQMEMSPGLINSHTQTQKH